MKYKIKIAYEGTHYSGWQVQPNSLSIQEIIEKNLSLLLKSEKIAIQGSGRTDAGVHALGQVAHFVTEAVIDPRRFIYGMNGLLPSDIRILEICPVSDDFHAQRSATSKIYHYHLWLETVADPFLRHLHTHFPRPIDLELLEKARNLFLGTHDFATFANVGSCVKTTVRHIHRIDICKQRGGIRLEFEGNGFLYKMVRNITGTLLEVASGKMPIENIPILFAAKDRRKSGVAAPARGLFLAEVIYTNYGANSEKEPTSLKSLSNSPLIASYSNIVETITPSAEEPSKALSPRGESSNPMILS
jgi:tRNA pseudouridine38-40 synthase